MMFGELSNYTAATKQAYESAYGYSLGIANLTTGPRFGASVNSSVSRRSITVAFSATIPAGNGEVLAMAQAAAATAKTLTATTFSANVAIVTAAFGSSVAAPNASSITVSSPVVSGGASGSSGSSDDGNGAVIGGAIGGAVAFIIIVALLYMFCRENTGKDNQGEI